MPISTRVKRYLQASGARFKIHRLPVPVVSLKSAVITMGIEPNAVTAVQVFQHPDGPCLIVYPLTHRVNSQQLYSLLGEGAKSVDITALSRLFDDCAPSALPPLATPYNLKLIVEKSLLNNDVIYFHAGCPQTLVAVDVDEFRFLNPGALLTHVSELDCTDDACIASNGLDESIGRKIKSLHRLPPMPTNVLNILQLINDPDSSVKELSALIESDPSLTLQIMRYARSPLFAFRGDVDTVQDAITRVLGYDLVGNIALGVTTCKSFNMPANGPLSVSSYWRKALFCAELSRLLADRVAPAIDIIPAKAYLCGMLHQFGLVLMAHLFPSEFSLLCRLVEREPEQPLYLLEKRVMGFGQAKEILAVGYAKIGGWLLDEWFMQEEVVKSAMDHTTQELDLLENPYVALMQLVNYLLTVNGVEYATLKCLDERIPGLLGIPLDEAQTVTEELIKNSDSIDQLSATIAA